MKTLRETRLELLSDEQLVALTQEGDQSAFNRLVGRWEESLYGFVRRTLGDPEDARDVCQETLVKAYLNIGRLRERSKFKAWIHHIALNLCLDRFRSGRAESLLRTDMADGLDTLEDPAERAHGRAPDHQAMQAQLSAALGDALRRLPVEQRTAILLREYQGFTSDEIGQMTGVPAATVRTRIYYGLRTLRKTLGDRGITSAEMS